uniref:Hypothetical secreted protein 334 n=1 Tax=Amblyomma variegatum TaxID=34610 RepID=F0JA35_AMBVA|nr:TPA_inf: hypothetical secreted protein 334 [Amblyomma variegatum]
MATTKTLFWGNFLFIHGCLVNLLHIADFLKVHAQAVAQDAMVAHILLGVIVLPSPCCFFELGCVLFKSIVSDS